MIGYVTLGTNDKERAVAFYDALLAELGASRFMEEEQFTAWSAGYDKPGLSVTHPWDGKPATHGNGTMVALVVDSTEQVDRVYHKAIELGAQCEGPAGPREGGFYAGYFRDLDGNKLSVFHFAGEMPES
jgi:catechol 2,3-dioxygenase-like lactoylglutathione lyase family enzyme